MEKKLITAIFTVFFGMATFLAGYLFHLRSQNSAPDTEAALIHNSLIDRFNPAEEKRSPSRAPLKLSNEEVEQLVLSSDESAVLGYSSSTGAVVSIPLSTTEESTSTVDTVQARAENISWSPDRKQLIAASASGAVLRNREEGLSQSLDPTVRQAIFSPWLNKIATLTFDFKKGEGSIAVSEPTGANFLPLLTTRTSSWKISWVSSDRLSLMTLPSAAQPYDSLFLLDTGTKKLTNVLSGKKSLDVLWAPEGDRFIYSHQDPGSDTVQLRLHVPASGADIPLSLSTQASKCAWSRKNGALYCAVPSAVGNTAEVSDQIVRVTLGDIPSQEIIRTAGFLALGSLTDLLLTKHDRFLILRSQLTKKTYLLDLSSR